MAKKTNKQKNAIIAIIIGGLLLLAALNAGGGREAKPSFDGVRNYFNIQLLDHAEIAEAGGLYWVDLRISNPDTEGGTMYVQCSILDREQNEWIAGLQSVTMLDTDDNCVDDEPFTQIAQVTLEGLKYTDTKFTFEVPNTPDGDNVIWCETFERCWAEDVETMGSDYVLESIEVIRSDNNPNNDIEDGDMCEFDSECKKFWFIGEQVCVDGYCVDQEDSGEEKAVEMPEINVGDWVQDNKIALVFTGLLLVLAGSMVIYKKPKTPKGYYV